MIPIYTFGDHIRLYLSVSFFPYIYNNNNIIHTVIVQLLQVSRPGSSVCGGVGGRGSFPHTQDTKQFPATRVSENSAQFWCYLLEHSTGLPRLRALSYKTARHPQLQMLVTCFWPTGYRLEALTTSRLDLTGRMAHRTQDTFTSLIKDTS